MLPNLNSSRRVSPGVFVVLLVWLSGGSFAQTPQGLAPADAMSITREIDTLNERGQALAKTVSEPAAQDRLADALVYLKGVRWAMKYEPNLAPADIAVVKQALVRCRERLDALADGRPAWPSWKGKLVRGYRSAIDGSVQPFGLIVPAGHDPAKPIRLDVVLHGSTKPVGMSELRFMQRFEANPNESPPEAEFIELHPLGRVENCYRWSGETDVFEAIDAVCRQYNIDRDRIVLRGMSMGASGTWHLGLKHPDRFVALGPYCGYVDTREFSQTPLPNFVKVGPLPEHQEKSLHMLDSIDYAANAGIVPAIACMGEKDIFFQAHVLMGNAMRKEGLEMVNLISPGTGHVIDPVTQAEQLRRIKEYADRGLNRVPRRLRFVTWTLKYGRCHWLEVLDLDEHYTRAEIDASWSTNDSTGETTVEFKELKNVRRFALRPAALGGKQTKVRIEGQEIAIPDREEQAQFAAVFARHDGRWNFEGDKATVKSTGKRPGLQGPIDDAFTSPFLCVRGTRKGWNPGVQAWADANLKRFAYEWSRYFRGELPIKNDVDVTPDDIQSHNLILFGDPGSNALIEQVLPHMPLQWTREELVMGGRKHAAADHAPAVIQPNLLAANRYVVINSGHTFHESELALLNYLLFPRHGDWAVLKVGGKSPNNPSEPLEEDVVQAGYFDELWRFRH